MKRRPEEAIYIHFWALGGIVGETNTRTALHFTCYIGLGDSIRVIRKSTGSWGLDWNRWWDGLDA